jgi:hypothetical protein
MTIRLGQDGMLRALFSYHAPKRVNNPPQVANLPHRGLL